MSSSPIWHSWSRPALPLVVVATLLCLGVLNVVAKATWRPYSDGILWRSAPQGVVVRDISSKSTAYRLGVRRDDLLVNIDDAPVLAASDVFDLLQQSDGNGDRRYTILRPGAPAPMDLRIPVSRPPLDVLYFVLAAVGVFTLIVGGAVRVRRPLDPATLHFLWLAVAFFGVCAFSYTERFDRLDWTFYWADAVATLALPPLFLHFTMIFPDRPRRWSSGRLPSAVILAAYIPAVVLGACRVIALAMSKRDPQFWVTGVVGVLDRADYVYLAGCIIGGLIGLARALSQVCTITARRQLRWIAWGTALGGGPFAIVALPYALNANVATAMQVSAVMFSLIPLAYASAIVRYRLLDIEIIVKRTFIYATAICVIALIYVGLLQSVERVFRFDTPASQWSLALLATLVAVLLAPPVKDFVQTALDRVFYRDRYDYRRALVGFARDLNSDLDLNRLADRLVTRVVETLVVDRMALMLENDAATHFGSVRASGFGDRHPPALAKRSAVGARLAAGHVVALDDPTAVGRFVVEEIEFWRDAGL
jgi:two-component system NtrC family sensor kinase